MNAAEARREMEACVASLQERLHGVTTSEERLRLAEQAKHQIRLFRKAFKRRIDKHGWYPIHMRAGIERKLQEITEGYLAAVDQMVAGPAEGSSAPAEVASSSVEPGNTGMAAPAGAVPRSAGREP